MSHEEGIDYDVVIGQIERLLRVSVEGRPRLVLRDILSAAHSGEPLSGRLVAAIDELHDCTVEQARALAEANEGLRREH